MVQHHTLVTFTAAATLGVFFLVLANRLKVSAIVVLLIGGILAGPDFLGLVNPEDLGGGLNVIISLAVGIILFEGGLTLDIKGYRQVSREIWGVLTTGVLVTWLSTTVFIKLVFGFAWDFCLFSASLIIVTGPTVIGPLLQRIRVKKNLHSILHWEGVLIDPIGVFVALLCYEYMASTGDSSQLILGDFLLRFAVGLSLGVVFGQLIYLILQRNWVEKEYFNITVLVCAITNFALADTIVAESGLLSVTVAGLMVGYRKPPGLASIVTYKVELKDFLIGLLFVLLAAKLELSKFTDYGVNLIWVLLAVMFIARPLNIFLSIRKSIITFREKLFLSWIAPRGIVAASMASIFALRLSEKGYEHAGFLETFVYSVIAGTVIFQGFTAKWVGHLLGVLVPKPTGWIIVGAHRLGRALAHFIADQGYSVVLLDTNAREVRQAVREGLSALCEDAMSIDPDQHSELYGTGHFLAITSNEDLNRLVCQRWHSMVRDATLYRWEKDGREKEVAKRLSVGENIWKEGRLEHWMAPDEDQIPLQRIQVEPEQSYPADNVLLAFSDNEIQPGPFWESTSPASLLILKETNTIQTSKLPIRREFVIFSERRDLESLYARMLELAAKTVPGIDKRKLLGNLLEREEEFTSLLGHGISMPHTYSAVIEEPILMVARPKRPIPCIHTGTKIELVFMLISPEDEPTEHLTNISQIARLISKETGRNALMAAENQAELFKAVIQG